MGEINSTALVRHGDLDLPLVIFLGYQYLAK